MINKISKLKDFGIFQDFTWKSNLPEFKKFNLIYGWNGTGKTTLSKFFALLETGESKDFENLEYEVEDGIKNKTKNGAIFNQKIPS